MRFTYEIAAHPTRYDGVLFHSRLEARWAAFFDLSGWMWQYEPIDLKSWTPDFYVKFNCGHSECTGYHDLYVEVKPFRSIEEFKGHPAYELFYDYGRTFNYKISAVALFGAGPEFTYWEMSHGAGGGSEEVKNWVNNAYNQLPDKSCTVDELWKEAGNLVQYQGRR